MNWFYKNCRKMYDDIISIVDKEVIGYDKPLDQVIKKSIWE